MSGYMWQLIELSYGWWTYIDFIHLRQLCKQFYALSCQSPLLACHRIWMSVCHAVLWSDGQRMYGMLGPATMPKDWKGQLGPIITFHCWQTRNCGRLLDNAEWQHRINVVRRQLKLNRLRKQNPQCFNRHRSGLLTYFYPT